MIFVIASGGGFAWESKQLIEKLIDDQQPLIVAYVCSSYEFRAFFHSLNYVEYDVITHKDGFKFRSLVNIVRAIWTGISVIRKNKVDKVVCIGHAGAIPFFIAAKLSGKETIYIESLTRTNIVSRTARLLLKMRLIEHVYVQWPNLEQLPKLIYRGNIL
jgi:UDP-N-acetylglucosamine:LPS N-acetylglucosamine transferase